MTPLQLDEALIYRKGSRFQRWAYEHAARFFHKRGVRRYGCSDRGNRYAHLLHPEDTALNFLSPAIARALADRFNSHKAGDRDRAETNTVASQPCCFNLFVPLAADLPLASVVFSELMGTPVAVEHIELEFTPDHLRALPGYELRERSESLGDQSGNAGTDADVAVFYQAGGRRGILLVELKYIESEFSACRAYATKNAERANVLRPLCNSSAFVPLVTESRRDARGKPLCGYTKYRNWELTQHSACFDWESIAALPACPFSGSAQQLWRNLLLAEHVAKQRHLDTFGFWVMSPSRNDKLWTQGGEDVFDAVSRLLRPNERARFRRMTIESVLNTIESQLASADARRSWWIEAFRYRYVPASPA